MQRHEPIVAKIIKQTPFIQSVQIPVTPKGTVQIPSLVSDLFGHSQRYKVMDETTRCFVIDAINALIGNQPNRGARYTFPDKPLLAWSESIFGTDQFYAANIPVNGDRVLLLWLVYRDTYRCFAVDEECRVFCYALRAPRSNNEIGPKSRGYYDGTVVDAISFYDHEKQQHSLWLTNVLAHSKSSYMRLSLSEQNIALLITGMELDEHNTGRDDCPFRGIYSCIYKPMFDPRTAQTEHVIIAGERNPARKYKAATHYG
jgi:hypothetical protein